MAGRPTLYSTALAEKILDQLACKALTEILATPGMPAYRTVMSWLREREDFRHLYAQAREDQADYDADLVVEIRGKMLRGEIAADVGRAAIDSCKWTAGKRKPKVYSDKLDITLEATVKGSVTYRANMPLRQPPAE